MLLSPCGRNVLLLAVALGLPGPLRGQLVALKTVPVSAGDQFLIFPSENLAMGGVSIAIDDRLLDPFENPAMGVRFGEAQFYSSPTFYSVSNSSGSARTLPVGSWFNSGGWFGGGYAALQNLTRGGEFFGPLPLIDGFPAPGSLSDRSATNKYAHLRLGRAVTPDLAIAVSAFFADLGAIDGVEHLYARANGIVQDGDIMDVRIGLSKEFTGDRRLQAVLLHNRFNMTHDVAYVDWVVVDPVAWIWEPQGRLETNLDQSRTWGVHLGYHQPLGTHGWRVGGILTANRKLHPKIPNYEIMNIPRDPGHSNAFNLGVGLSKLTEQTLFGIDVVYQPATSDTWAEAESPVLTAGGSIIPTGGRTVENAFSFSNAFVNMGVRHDLGGAAFQLGVQVGAYDFHLDQWDNVEQTFRRQDENWTEWTPSWGLQIPLKDFELRYFGRVITGTGRPGIAGGVRGGVPEADLAAGGNDILLAPEGPLTLDPATVMTHQVSVSIPIR